MNEFDEAATSSESNEENKFTVDLHGVVELLSNHLYSGPQVFIRELLQNGVDALTARRENDPGFAGSVTFEVGTEDGTEHGTEDGRRVLTVTDEGLGLSAAEAEMFMSVIGRSSKRDEIGMARETLIGQFGVGILSCFTVSEAITVTSRSAAGGEAITWVGRADGTWSVEPAAHHPIGSTVRLVARPGEEKYFDPEFIRSHLATYGELLPHRIWLRQPGQTPILISRDAATLGAVERNFDDVMEIGRELLGFEAIDVFPIRSAVGQAYGAAFVLPTEPAPNSMRSDRVYVKGMLVSAATDRLLPDWAFFVRCIVMGDGLKPTASREELHHDETLSLTRSELGESVRNYLIDLARRGSPRLNAILKVHHQAMKALAIHDPEFLALVIDWLPIETAEGRMSFGEFRARHPVASYTLTVEEFRQLAPIATAQGIGLLCGGYTHDAELAAAADRQLDSFSATPVRVEDLFTGFGVLSDDEVDRVGPLVKIVGSRIESFDVEVAVRRFEPHETPAILAMDETAFRLRSLRRTQESSDELFAGIIGAASENLQESRPVFCLNFDNPVVARLIDMAEDADLVIRAVEVLYLQALLMGHHPLQVAESALLNTSLSAILDRAIDGGHNPGPMSDDGSGS